MARKRLDEAIRRRVRAGRMLLAGKTPAEAARAVGVARQQRTHGRRCWMKAALTHCAPCLRGPPGAAARAAIAGTGSHAVAKSDRAWFRH